MLLAPNGQPSNLTAEQYKLVRTPAFKKWFGDWENDPETASKVVDSNGEPKVVYHGTKKGGFSVFDENKIGENTHNADIGFFFIDTYQGAKSYSGTNNKNSIQAEPISTNYTVFLNLKNPKYIFWGNGKYQNSWNAKVGDYNGIKEFIKSASEENYDGAIIEGVNDSGEEDCYYDCGNMDYIAFNSKQIKLADGTNTTFDPNNDDIRYAGGGEVDKSVYEKSLKIIIKNVNKENKYKGAYKRIFEIIEKEITLYNPYGTIYEELNGTDFKIEITPIPEEHILDRIKQIPNIEVVDKFETGGTVLLAPNGQPSNLTPEQYKLVRTPAFKKWFGDWENDPKNASKVVDENGEPQAVYHSSKNEFNTFKKEKISENFDYSFGFHFSNNLEDSKNYGKITKSFFLNIKNPFVFNVEDKTNGSVYIDANRYHAIHEIVNSRKTNKEFDGVIAYSFTNGYVAMYANQIKLADGTNTTFDPNNDDIRFETGGNVLLAPNGQQSNLTAEQYKAVRTPEFKAWFGDWENDPKNASKVVDENGEPLVVYHGSELRFTEFKNRNPNIKGYFFSNEINTSRTYGEKTYEVFLNIKSPFSLDAKGGNFQTDLDIEVAVKYPNEEEYKTTVKENSDNIVRLAMGIDKNSFWKLDGSFDGCIFYNFKDQSLSSQRNEIQNTYVAFKSNQIKLADGTNTTFDPNNDDIRFQTGGTVLLAPNGQPSNLTTEQYKLVRTPAFKKWFGDWENAPENASKVVDKNGEPKVVFHGTNTEFTSFSKERINSATGFGDFGAGFYFTASHNTAKYYTLKSENGRFIMSVFLNIRNPFIIDLNWEKLSKESIDRYKNLKTLDYEKEVINNSLLDEYRPSKRISKEIGDWRFQEILSTNGFDGVFVNRINIHEKSSINLEDEILYLHEIIAFKNTQIKLAEGINTTFDPNNEDIRFENGGLTEIEQWKLEQAQNDQQAFNLLQNYFGFELPENADTYEYKKGGNLDKDIECHKCGWEWDKKDSEKFDMYVCHKCGFDNSDFYKLGGRTVAQTPAPFSERIYGSKKNKPSSSKDSSSAESIKFDQKTLTSIENKVEKHNAEHRDKRISLSIAKAIVRRGMGAYSKSHRPTIKGGKPNSRVAWGLARLNAFIYKVVNGVSKSGKYSQDNDLLDELGIAHEKFKTGGKISKKNKHGDCYVVAGRIALNNRLPKGENREFVGEPYVIHAQVIGQGAIEGLKYGHAWVEDDIYVYDYSNGRELKIPKVVYYKLGQVIEQQPIYFKYTFGEAKRKMAETGHFGSWDLITESGL